MSLIAAVSAYGHFTPCSKLEWASLHLPLLDRHLESLKRYSEDHQQIILLRKPNPEALGRLNDLKARPKPLWVKMKTATRGPSAGLVVFPLRSHFSSRAQYKNAQSIWLKEWESVSRKYGLRVDVDSGIVLDSMGRPFTSDYDLTGVFDIRSGKRVNFENDFSEGSRLWALNESGITGPTTERETWLFQHGGVFDLPPLERIGIPLAPAIAIEPGGQVFQFKTAYQLQRYIKNRKLLLEEVL